MTDIAGKIKNVVENVFAVRRYKESLTLGPFPEGRVMVTRCGRSGSESRVDRSQRGFRQDAMCLCR